MKRILLAAAAILAAVSSVAVADQQTLKNGSMESGAGPNSPDPRVAAGWTEFGLNVERSEQYSYVPPTDGHSLKAFGDNDSSTAGAYQEITGVSPGQSVTFSARLYTAANDKLRGSGQAGIVLEFLNLFGGTIGTGTTVLVLDASSPADTWIPATIGPLTAPANTAKIRVTCRLQWVPGDILGACWWDDARAVVNGVERISNGSFETAGTSGGQSPIGIDDWQGFNDQEKSSDFAQHGTASLKLGVRDQYSGLYQSMGIVSEGDVIHLKARVWNPAADQPSGNFRAGIKLEFSPNGEVPPPVETLTFDADSPTDEWVPVTVQAEVPAIATAARIVCIWFADAGSDGEVHFDSVSAVGSSSPGNRLLNESFEFGPGGPNGIDDWFEFFSDGQSECQKSCFVVPATDGFCTARATGTSVSGVYQVVPATPGELMTATVNIRTPSFNPITGGTTRAGIKIEWVAGSVPPPVDIGVPNGSPNTIGPGAPTNTWIPLTIDFTMPPGANAIARYVCIIEKGTSTTGHIYFDSCESVVVNGFPGADVDGDADEDLIDAWRLQQTFTGPGAGPPSWPGTVFDWDDDGDVDFVDFGDFAVNMSGPN
ncbi:MAG: hypothetical protein AMXMBFR47_32400 [Planctomycetota bacterium]